MLWMVFGRETTGGAGRRASGAVPAAGYPQTSGGVIRRIELGRDEDNPKAAAASETECRNASYDTIQLKGA